MLGLLQSVGQVTMAGSSARRFSLQDALPWAARVSSTTVDVYPFRKGKPRFSLHRIKVVATRLY